MRRKVANVVLSSAILVGGLGSTLSVGASGKAEVPSTPQSTSTAETPKSVYLENFVGEYDSVGNPIMLRMPFKKK